MWMTATSWGPEPWIVAALVGFVAMGALGGGVSLRAMRRLRVALADERGRELSEAFRQVRASAPSALRLRTAIGVGILALMTVKPPDAATASLVLAAAVLAGAVASVPSALAAAGERDRSHADA
jgi:uncharacterized membrane protein